jgi:hypothetical protein
LQHEGLADNLELLVLGSAMTRSNPPVHAAHVVGEWIARRLERARPSGSVVDEPCKAQRLLGLLAIAQVDRIVDIEDHPRFTREELRTVFWTMLIKPEDEDEGWLLVERCERAGLLVRLHSQWDFAYPALARWFCAEQLIEQERYWVSWGLKYQPLLQWTAALIAQGGDSFHAQRFCKRMLATLPSWSDLSWLELADVLTQFHDQSCPAMVEVRVLLQAKLRALAQLDAGRLAHAVQERATRLGLDGGLSVVDRGSQESIVLPDLGRETQDLAGLLQLLQMTAPRAAEKDWLEDRHVLRELVHALCSVRTTELKWRCAAWLRRSSLWRTLQTEIFPPRRWPAWEVLARIASDAQRDQTTRMAAQSVLTRDDLMLALWQQGDSYRALVYELLLMTGKRLHCVYPSGQWELVV